MLLSLVLAGEELSPDADEVGRVVGIHSSVPEERSPEEAVAGVSSFGRSVGLKVGGCKGVLAASGFFSP